MKPMRTLPPLLLITALLAGCSNDPTTEPGTRPAKIYTVPKLTDSGYRSYPGKVKAAQSAQLGFEVPGRIIDMPLNDGDTVEKGQVLARLDDRDYLERFNSAKAQIDAARAEFDRQKNLYERDAISIAQFQQKKRDFQVAEAEFRRAAKALEDTVLRAPFSGRVSSQPGSSFETVQAQQPVVVIQDLSSLKIEISISENDVIVAQGKRDLEEIRNRIDAYAEFPAIPGRQFPVTLSSTQLEAQPLVRTYQIQFALERPGDVNILPGMTTTVYARPNQAVLLARPTIITVPASALTQDNASGKSIVWKVTGPQGEVEQIPVVTGSLIGEHVEIKEGLTPGDRVVISGIRFLSPGMKVKPIEGGTLTEPDV